MSKCTRSKAMACFDMKRKKVGKGQKELRGNTKEKGKAEEREKLILRYLFTSL